MAIVPPNSWFALKAVGENCSPLEGVLGLCAPGSARRTGLWAPLTWASSPSEAFDQAKAKGKLVMLLHVSGNFEDSGFT